MAFNQTNLWNLNLKLFNVGGYIKRMQLSLFNRKALSLMKQNKNLRIENNCKKAYVLALGPSLKEVNLKCIEGDTIVVNRFYIVGKQFTSFVPTYYMMIDYGFNKPEHQADFKEALNMYAHNGTKFILNAKLAGSKLLDGYDPNIFYFINCIDGKIKTNKKYTVDGLFPAFQNVVGAAILMLMTMGYKNINLLGCDFNSFASRKRIHCYNEKNSDERFIPMYRELFVYSFAAKDHCDLETLSSLYGCTITNTTKGSLIDAYTYEIDESLYYDKEEEEYTTNIKKI